MWVINMPKKEGRIYRVSGPVIIAENLDANMYDVVYVGEEELIGEVIQIDGNRVTVQVYEDTSGLKPGEKVITYNQPLTVELGPGILKSIYDGIQRPLDVLKGLQGDFIKRGARVNALDRKKKWKFKPLVKKGDVVKAGDIIGEVKETDLITHKILVPPNYRGGKVVEIKDGSFSVEEVIAKLDSGEEIKMMHIWPIRKPRPYKEKLPPVVPMITGMRILDALFPIAKGGTAAIPGPFGSGKTVTQQSLAKYSDAQVIVYIGCGERGNEMTEVLEEFPELIDPNSGKPLMNRTVLVANTSNMPVAAREASIYTGITLAEYYRDMGYDVALMADSTSRWAEAMREISSRLEEIPGEEGYPAKLSSKLSEFYERAGRVVTLSGKKGSVTVIGAVSPPGGDFSEPVTQGTLRIVKVFWALDAKLARRKHFPAINWLQSYSLYKETLSEWFAENVAKDWDKKINRAMSILQEEEKLQEIVQLVGSDALPDKEQGILLTARLLREFFLQQNAYDENDAYSNVQKTNLILDVILQVDDLIRDAISKGIKAKDLTGMRSLSRIAEIRYSKDYAKIAKEVMEEIKGEIENIEKLYAQ